MKNNEHGNGWMDVSGSNSVAALKGEQPTVFGTHQQRSTATKDGAPKMHHDGSFRKYMEGKINKLQIQFKNQSSTLVSGEVDGALGQLFQGVSIFVNGYTEPSHSELKNIMAQYGGEFHNYYSRSSVTHIVCSNLPDAKVKQFEKERSPTPVVRPEWVVECVKAKRVLPITDFVLWQLRPGGPGQRTLSMLKAGASPYQKKGPSSGGITSNGSIQNQKRQRGDDVKDAEMGNDDAEYGMNGLPCKIYSGRNTANKYDAMRLEAAQRIAEKMRSECESLKGRPKSSSDDPEFVNSFYRASRLHFIGTWKSRLEKMMASDILHDAPEPTKESERTVIHIDMDCFFASVAEASHPEFSSLPVAVCHSNHKGSGEISSANYEARKYGLHASMFMIQAKKLCPDLIVVPYEFEKYEVVSEKMYSILFKHSSLVQPVSCDEAYLDVTGLGDPERIALSIRESIERETKCCASAGIGPNMLLARIATARAKPNDQCRITRECALQDLATLDVEELPGVGWRMGQKLREEGFHKIKDIQGSSEKRIQQILGNKTGSLVFNFAYGCDDRSVSPPAGRKSIGAEVNWGVRFQSNDDTNKFLLSICKQISERMKASNVKGKSLTIKIKRKKSGWTEPAKYLGMGSCDSLSKTITLKNGVRDTEEIYSESKILLDSFQFHFSEIRGMGISVSKLEETSSSKKSPSSSRYQRKIDSLPIYSKQGTENKTSIIGSEPGIGELPKAKPKPGVLSGFVAKRHADSSQTSKVVNSKKSLHLIDANSIDRDVLEELPIEIRREIEVAYGLKQNSCTKERFKNTRDKSTSVASASRPRNGTATGKQITKMPQVFDEPLRLSQIDQSVFRELPESLQKDVLKNVDLSKKSSRKRTASVFHGPKRKAHNSSNDGEAAYSSTFKSLVSSLQNDSLQSLASCIHSNKVSKAIWVLESGLADGRLESLFATNTGDRSSDLDTLIDILKNEFKYSNNIGIPLESKWSFCRGIHRLGSRYNSFKGYANRLVQVMQQELLTVTGTQFCLD